VSQNKNENPYMGPSLSKSYYTYGYSVLQWMVPLLPEGPNGVDVMCT